MSDPAETRGLSGIDLPHGVAAVILHFTSPVPNGKPEGIDAIRQALNDGLGTTDSTVARQANEPLPLVLNSGLRVGGDLRDRIAHIG